MVESFDDFNGNPNLEQIVYNSEVHEIGAQKIKILNLKALSAVSESEKKDFMLRFNRAVESIMPSKISDIPEEKTFEVSQELYVDSLILAIYLELTSPQSGEIASQLKDQGIPCVTEGVNPREY
jgi:hypothetical protein